MMPGHPEILLYRPEIPQNVGAIGRLAAATASRLHLVGPFPFSLDDKNLRRPGLDYWPFLDIEIHDHVDQVLSRFRPEEIGFFSKRAGPSLWQMPRGENGVRLCVFGQETRGLPKELETRFPSSFYRIPMYHPGVRSLNVANAVSVVVYRMLEPSSHALEGPDGNPSP